MIAVSIYKVILTTIWAIWEEKWFQSRLIYVWLDSVYESDFLTTKPTPTILPKLLK